MVCLNSEIPSITNNISNSNSINFVDQNWWIVDFYTNLKPYLANDHFFRSFFIHKINNSINNQKLKAFLLLYLILIILFITLNIYCVTLINFIAHSTYSQLMNSTKVHFNKDYEELLAEVVHKINKNSINQFNSTHTPLNTHIKFFNPLKNI